MVTITITVTATVADGDRVAMLKAELAAHELGDGIAEIAADRGLPGATVAVTLGEEKKSAPKRGRKPRSGAAQGALSVAAE
jgi:hypothetical protein